LIPLNCAALGEKRFQKKKETNPLSLLRLVGASCLEVVFCAACTMTTTSMLRAEDVWMFGAAITGTTMRTKKDSTA
jgi:hypothetical protein